MKTNSNLWLKVKNENNYCKDVKVMIFDTNYVIQRSLLMPMQKMLLFI